MGGYQQYTDHGSTYLHNNAFTIVQHWMVINGHAATMMMSIIQDSSILRRYIKVQLPPSWHRFFLLLMVNIHIPPGILSNTIAAVVAYVTDTNWQPLWYRLLLWLRRRTTAAIVHSERGATCNCRGVETGTRLTARAWWLLKDDEAVHNIMIIEFPYVRTTETAHFIAQHWWIRYSA